MIAFSALLSLGEGNPPVNDGFPSQRLVTRNFGVFFDLNLNKRLNKQWRRSLFRPVIAALEWVVTQKNEQFRNSCAYCDVYCVPVFVEGIHVVLRLFWVLLCFRVSKEGV